MTNGIYMIQGDENNLIWVYKGFVINGSYAVEQCGQYLKIKKPDGYSGHYTDLMKLRASYIMDNPLPKSRDYNEVLNKVSRLINI